MEIIETNIEGLLIIQPDVFLDDRGYFFESFSLKRYKELGLKTDFVQDNISKSKRGTIRGLHYQIGEFAQSKLCQVIKGKVLDVAVDIRHGSPTFGKFYAVELLEDNHKQFFIPTGFAHGFSVLSDEAVFMYRCSSYYSKEHERAIIYNDADLNIDWRMDDPVVSTKDLNAKRFRDIEKDFIFNNG